MANWYPNRIDPLSGIFVQQLAEKLSESNSISVLHVSSDPSLQYSKLQVEENVTGLLHEVRAYYKPTNNQLIRLIRVLKATHSGYKALRKRAGRPRLVHIQVLSRFEWLPLWFKWRYKIPFIVTEHWSGYMTGEFNALPRFRKKQLSFQLKNAAAVVAVSQSLKKAMEGYFPKIMIRVIPNLVDIPPMAEPVLPDDGKIRILNIADLRDSKKNVSGIIKAMSKVIIDFSNAELHIIGHGPDHEKLCKLAFELGLLEKHVFFDGIFTHKETIAKIAQAGFYVCPSYVETFSIATAEALLCGIPVVATNCGGPGEYVTPAVGLLIEPNDQEQLESAMIKMCGTFKTYNSAIIKSYACDTFNPEKVIGQINQLYRDLT